MRQLWELLRNQPLNDRTIDIDLALVHLHSICWHPCVDVLAVLKTCHFATGDLARPNEVPLCGPAPRIKANTEVSSLIHRILTISPRTKINNKVVNDLTRAALLFLLIAGLMATHPPLTNAGVSLTYLHHVGGEVGDLLAKMMADLEVKYDIEINIVHAPDTQLVERAFVMAAGDVLPDIIRIDQQQVRALVVAGLLTDLTPFLEREGVNLQTDFIPLTVETFSYQGAQYAIPAETSSNALFYNRQMFDNAGLTYPTTDWASDEWTWDEFAEAARRLTADTNGDGTPDQFGIMSFGHFYFYPWLWGYDWVDEGLTRFLGTEPGVIDALQRLADLRNITRVVGGNFIAGTAAMNVNGNWYLGNLRDQTFLEWDLAAMPKGSERATVFYPNGFAIGATSKHKELAWQIIRELMLVEEGVKRYTDAVTRVPSHRNYWDYYLESQNHLYPGRNNMVFVTALLFGRIWTLRFATNWSAIDQTIRAQWNQVWDGRKSAAQAMNEVADQVNSLLKEAHTAAP